MMSEHYVRWATNPPDMNVQRVQQQPAFVLHRRPYRETSWLLEVFSREHGRVGLVARAARQSRSRVGARLEPARALLLSWTMRGDLGYLTQSENMGASPNLGGDLLLSALYLNELLLRLMTRHDPHPVLFDFYQSTLQELEASQGSAVPLRRFEKQLLQEMGYGLNLDKDIEGQAISAAHYYEYVAGQGASVVSNQSSEHAIPGQVLLALRDNHLDEMQSRREAKRLLRAALREHLGHKPLQTPELFRRLRGLGQKAVVASGQQT